MVRPFRLLSKSRIAKLQIISSSAYERWASDWLRAEAAPSSVEVYGCEEKAGELKLAGSDCWRHLSQDNLDLWYPLRCEDRRGLLRCLLSADELNNGGHATVDAVVDDALADLAQPFFRQALDNPGFETTAFDVEPPPTYFGGRGSGMAIVQFPLVKLSMLISSELVLRLSRDAAGPSAKPSRSLTPVKEAIDGCRLRGRVLLGLGSCTVAELHALEPGDVITTQTPLTTAFSLQLADGRKAATCRLGRRGNRKAIVLEAPQSGESHARTTHHA